jgi:hypothetical protein
MTNVKEVDREAEKFFTYQISRQEPTRCRSLSPLSLDSELSKQFGEPTPTKEWKQRAEANKKRRKMWKNSSNSFAFKFRESMT